MLNFTWNVFSQTGNLDTYLLFKEIEVEGQDKPETDEDLALMDSISQMTLGPGFGGGLPCFKNVKVSSYGGLIMEKTIKQ